ncbi:flagellar biosynthesis regulator FlaF [Roseibium sp.]|uniref:flagellar biosynthesis regulator FlaF n=1 Tax=Roseibium sp. TaxID=1936156 RepID=UPI003A98189E
MYNLSYAETMDDICADEKLNELEAMNIVIAKLEQAKDCGPNSRETVEALFFTRRLWGYFLESLTDDNNELPTALRAQLISIGIWAIKETERIRQNESESLDPLIQINSIIRDSLNG